MQKLQTSAARARKHDPASKKTSQAQGAALPPSNEKVAGARANQVGEMSQAETKKPEPKSFRDMLRAEIQKVMPKKMEEGKDYMKGDDRQQLKTAMTGNVDQQKTEASGGIEQAKDASPDISKVEGKEVTPLANEPPPPSPAPVNSAQAMPDPKPEKEVSLEEGKKSTGDLMKSNELDSKQMEKANDPRFSKVNAEKSKADQFADSAPKKYRTDEQKIVSQAASQATAEEKRSLAGMQKTAGGSAIAIKARQLTAKQKDEAARKAVVDHIQGIFDKTKNEVDRKLESLDTEVSTLFDTGADQAVERMKKYVDDRFSDRYSGLLGPGRWLKDKLIPLPPEVKAWFDEANAAFQQDLDRLVDRVADLVEQRIREAKAIIDKGQAAIHTYVESLPKDLQAVGKSAEGEMKSRFDELRQGVEDKKNDLAQKLAEKYKQATEKGQAALKEMKDAHKSLYEKVKEAIEEVIKVLREFRTRVVAMLKKGKDTVDLIIKDPIGFLKNLLNAIKKGVSQFVDNIWTHLKAGFMKWLFGSLADAGIEMPSDFSLGSILKLVLQVLGLTYAKIRPKIVKIIGERNVTILEKAFELIRALWEGGPAALWEKMKEFLGDLKQMVIDAIQDWLISTVIKSAVTKLVSMFNPVGAIIQAIIMIYNTVMFLVERIRQIMEFVEAVINSVHKIATGNIGDAANWIEAALGRTVPLIIGFLARLLGLSGLTDKVVGIIKKLQAKVDAAVDKVIEKIVGTIRKLFGAGKAAIAKVLEWWKKEKKIPGDDETHRLFIEGGESNPETMVASSSPRRLEAFIVDIESSVQGNSQKVTAIATIRTESKKLKDALAALRKLGKKGSDAAKAPHIAKMEAAFDVIGQQLGILFAGDTSGTDTHPLELPWPKPAWNQYPPLYLFNNGTDKAPLWKITAKKNGHPGKKLVKVYYPDKANNSKGPGPGSPPSKLNQLGIEGKFRIEAKKSKVGPFSNDSTPGGKKINSLLEEFGWSASGEDMDGDHIKEIQFGGKDDLNNLWPLKASVNRGAGSKLSRAIIKIMKSEQTVDWLKRVKLTKKDSDRKKFTFIISKTTNG